MKKCLFLLAVVFAGQQLGAQNLQLHYLFGAEKPHLATRIEMHKEDAWGSTYFFVDKYYGEAPGLRGVNMVYWEIARGLKFWESPFEIHLEYNGGFGQYALNGAMGTYDINDAWLLGGHYTFANEDYSHVFVLQAMYKYIRFKEDLSFQVTGVWDLNFFDGNVTVDGYADFWKERQILEGVSTDYVFMTEVQAWYNVTDHFSAGGRLELTHNFIVEGFNMMPGPGIKWTF